MIDNMFAQGQQLDWNFDPLEVLRRFPADRRALLLHSGRYDPQWSRYSILSQADNAYRFTQSADQAGQSSWLGDGSACPAASWRHRPFADLRQVFSDHDALWLGYLSYDLGRFVENLSSRAATDRSWPVIQMHRCPGWLVYDGAEQSWRAYGTWRDQPPPLHDCHAATGDYQASQIESNMAPARYEAMVRQALEYIYSGDVFEVNLSQRFSASFSGDRRGLFCQLANRSPAWYGAYLELAGADEGEVCRTIASTSPELFLALDKDGKVVTRPIKGTRPASVAAAQLEQSEKDRAELNMVVDMLRNDLGRVCAYGSLQVISPRTIESHPTVHHGVATIAGRLHEDKSLVDLLRATMPGGSITGAPKVRAMEIIDELEPVRRGPYCGAIGYVYRGCGQFNIAIRSILLETDGMGADSRGRVDFSVGGGIVADSEPADEYQETLDKAAALLGALNSSGSTSARPVAVAATAHSPQ
jgi:para-aminobenzoate synthetase component 1